PDHLVLERDRDQVGYIATGRVGVGYRTGAVEIEREIRPPPLAEVIHHGDTGGLAHLERPQHLRGAGHTAAAGGDRIGDPLHRRQLLLALDALGDGQRGVENLQLARVDAQADRVDDRLLDRVV